MILLLSDAHKSFMCVIYAHLYYVLYPCCNVLARPDVQLYGINITYYFYTRLIFNTSILRAIDST